MNNIIFVGEINTPYNTIEECPNNVAPNGVMCKITLYEEFSKGLYGLNKGDEILILYWFEEVDRSVDISRSAFDNSKSGTFAMRTSM